MHRIGLPNFGSTISFFGDLTHQHNSASASASDFSFSLSVTLGCDGNGHSCFNEQRCCCADDDDNEACMWLKNLNSSREMCLSNRHGTDQNASITLSPA
jgi:hypothetical protein